MEKWELLAYIVGYCMAGNLTLLTILYVSPIIVGMIRRKKAK